MNKSPILEKIKLLETQIQKAKASLKSWASQISKHHKALKEISNQLTSIKEKLNLEEK